jgi:hypothetical protein
VLLAVTAFVTILTAGQILWVGLNHWTVAAQTLKVLNQLLIVLMPAEILHTVPSRIRSQVLVKEPISGCQADRIHSAYCCNFLGDSSYYLARGMGDRRRERHFHSAMLELGLLRLVVLVWVVSIALLARYAPAPKDARRNPVTRHVPIPVSHQFFA